MQGPDIFFGWQNLFQPFFLAPFLLFVGLGLLHLLHHSHLGPLRALSLSWCRSLSGAPPILVLRSRRYFSQVIAARGGLFLCFCFCTCSWSPVAGLLSGAPPILVLRLRRYSSQAVCVFAFASVIVLVPSCACSCACSCSCSCPERMVGYISVCASVVFCSPGWFWRSFQDGGRVDGPMSPPEAAVRSPTSFCRDGGGVAGEARRRAEGSGPRG